MLWALFSGQGASQLVLLYSHCQTSLTFLDKIYLAQFGWMLVGHLSRAPGSDLESESDEMREISQTWRPDRRSMV